MSNNIKNDYHFDFFLDKLANVLFRNLLQRTGSIFDALIQRTDGCLDVPWLLVQPHHRIHCSYKRYTNRHLSQHMIFQYCEEDSGEPVQMYILVCIEKLESSYRFGG